jgi:carbonic anhydrase
LKKLLRGVADFRKRLLPDYRETFARLAIGQKPDALFIACSDSRVVPNLFASTDPGDLFVMRNVGNLVPPCCEPDPGGVAAAEPAAIEFSVLNLNVRDIIVCGHSECGAMQALMTDPECRDRPYLKSWLRHAAGVLPQLDESRLAAADLTPHNRLSQLNVLQQIEHLKSYPMIRERLAANRLALHGWWFDIAGADVYIFDAAEDRFQIIDEDRVAKLLGC